MNRPTAKGLHEVRKFLRTQKVWLPLFHTGVSLQNEGEQTSLGALVDSNAGQQLTNVGLFSDDKKERILFLTATAPTTCKMYYGGLTVRKFFEATRGNKGIIEYIAQHGSMPPTGWQKLKKWLTNKVPAFLKKRPAAPLIAAARKA